MNYAICWKITCGLVHSYEADKGVRLSNYTCSKCGSSVKPISADKIHESNNPGDYPGLVARRVQKRVKMVKDA